MYLEWLEIPAERIPPNHYALLGLDDFESDEDTIQQAAKNRAAYLHQLAAGPNRKVVQEVLGQVAIARRTLSDAETRESYNQSLRDTSNAGSPSDQAKEVTAAQRRSLGEWKLHAASAAVLLAIVGGLYLYNLNPGGRRAATVPTSESSEKHSQSQSNDQLAAKKRKAPVATSSPNKSTGTKKSPVVQRRSTGSGLGKSLNTSFAEVLSDIENETDRAVTEFDPGAEFKPFVEEPEGEQWPEGLLPIKEFPKELDKAFQSQQGTDWYQIQKDRMVVLPDAKTSYYALKATSLRLKPGNAVALTSSICAGMRSEVLVGLAIGGNRIGMKPHKKGLVIQLKPQGKESKPKELARIKSAKNTAKFAIVRQGDSQLRWVIQVDDQVKSGQVEIEQLDKEASLTLVLLAPKKKQPSALWISDLAVKQ